MRGRGPEGGFCPRAAFGLSWAGRACQAPAPKPLSRPPSPCRAPWLLSLGASVSMGTGEQGPWASRGPGGPIGTAPRVLPRGPCTGAQMVFGGLCQLTPHLYPSPSSRWAPHRAPLCSLGAKRKRHSQALCRPHTSRCIPPGLQAGPLLCGGLRDGGSCTLHSSETPEAAPARSPCILEAGGHHPGCHPGLRASQGEPQVPSTVQAEQDGPDLTVGRPTCLSLPFWGHH